MHIGGLFHYQSFLCLLVCCRCGNTHHRAPAGDIRVSMMQECDFTSEARNIATFSSYLDQNDLRRIATAPFVYSQLTSKR